jgi:PKD repeat protein
VTIAGANLCSVTSVTFNGHAASFTVDSDSQIHATVPGDATTGAIEVTDAGGAIATTSTSFTVTADTTPPDTTITSGPPATTISSSAEFQFTATEPATYECSLDTVAFATCSSPATYTGLAAGPHTFRVRATDTAGNTDPTPAQQTWTVAPNPPPTARFTFSCTGLTCHLDGSGSADSDGTITGYAWDFGDGTSTTTSGATVAHNYPRAGGYTVTLTVTDNAGASASASKTVLSIVLTARGYKQGRLEKADLSWNAPSGTSIDIYRNGTRIATVWTTAYTDNIGQKGSGSYAYKVCAAVASCSDR